MLSLESARGTPHRQGRAPIVIAYYTPFGVAVSSALAIGLRGARVLSRRPDTGPRLLPELLGKLDITGRWLYIVDVPFDDEDPEEYVLALVRAGERAEGIVYLDHHEQDGVFLDYIPRRANIDYSLYENATLMAREASGGDPERLELALVGVTADRDPSILELVDRDTVENWLLPLSSTLEVLVRRDAQATADALMERGVEYLAAMESEAPYPPDKLSRRLVRVESRGAAVLLGFIDAASNRVWDEWLDRAVEVYMRRKGLDYAVVPVSRVSPETGQIVYEVRAIQYWLSDLPDVESLAPLALPHARVERQGRSVVIVRVEGRPAAERLARRLFEYLASHA